MTESASDMDRLKQEYADRQQRRSTYNALYSLFNPAQLYTLQHRFRDVARTLKKAGMVPLDDKRILEFGCGSGGVLLEYLSLEARPDYLHGIDYLENRVQSAAARLPALPLACADGQQLPYADATFDLVYQYTAFSSILSDEVKQRAAREILRVLKPEGAVLWYDFWLNPKNPQTRGIRPAEIRALFPNCTYEFHRITLAPPITRRLAPLSWTLCGLLEKLRLLNTHYLVLIRPN